MIAQCNKSLAKSSLVYGLQELYLGNSDQLYRMQIFRDKIQKGKKTEKERSSVK